jgi:Glycosyl hydrolases family 35
MMSEQHALICKRWLAGTELMGKLRTADDTYMKWVSLWWKELFKRMKPLLSASGGPILMVQIENEFGFWNAGGDTTYLQVCCLLIEPFYSCVYLCAHSYEQSGCLMAHWTVASWKCAPRVCRSYDTWRLICWAATQSCTRQTPGCALPASWTAESRCLLPHTLSTCHVPKTRSVLTSIYRTCLAACV